MTKKELEEKAQKIYDEAKRVYGTCKDGSFQCALDFNGYYKLQRQIEELGEENE